MENCQLKNIFDIDFFREKFRYNPIFHLILELLTRPSYISHIYQRISYLSINNLRQDKLTKAATTRKFFIDFSKEAS